MLVAETVKIITKKALDLENIGKFYYAKLMFSRIWIEYGYFNKEIKKSLCNKIEMYIYYNFNRLKFADLEIVATKEEILNEIPRMVDLTPPQHAMAEDALIAAWYFCHMITNLDEIDNCTKVIINKYFSICDEYIQHFETARNGGKFVDDKSTINSSIFAFERDLSCKYISISDPVVVSRTITANLSEFPMTVRWQG